MPSRSEVTSATSVIAYSATSSLKLSCLHTGQEGRDGSVWGAHGERGKTLHKTRQRSAAFLVGKSEEDEQGRQMSHITGRRRLVDLAAQLGTKCTNKGQGTIPHGRKTAPFVM